MSARLSEAAREMLERAGCSDVADDCITLPESDVMILLSQRAVADLNRQARDKREAGEL